MKLYIIMAGEEWEGSLAIKVFKNELKAKLAATKMQHEEDKEEYPTYHYYVREIEADLDE